MSSAGQVLQAMTFLSLSLGLNSPVLPVHKARARVHSPGQLENHQLEPSSPRQVQKGDRSVTSLFLKNNRNEFIYKQR